MKKLAYIFGIALFISGCGTVSHTINLSYDPIDPPRQFFTPKDKPPVLYLAPIIDNREIAVEHKPRFGISYRSGRLEEDPTLIGRFDAINKVFWRTSKTPPIIVGEALETEVRRFGVKTTKDRDSADGVLKASIEKFKSGMYERGKTKITVKAPQAAANQPNNLNRLALVLTFPCAGIQAGPCVKTGQLILKIIMAELWHLQATEFNETI